MSKFLTGSELENKLTDIIWNAKEYVIVISPFIKLDDHVRKIFNKVKDCTDIHLILIFGKNEDSKSRSLREEDFQYFQEFKNISILYNKYLHAKHYCNEKEGLITSLNLYDYSMINNIEYGVYFRKTPLNPNDRIFEETEKFTDDLIFEKSDVVFIKKPLYKKKMFGLAKTYLSSKVYFDVSMDFFNDAPYEIKKHSEINFDELGNFDNIHGKKPERKNAKDSSSDNITTGYCIRTGVEIPFDPSRPLCYEAYQTWLYFENPDYKENYCHKTGEKSNGKTSMRNPIL